LLYTELLVERTEKEVFCVTVYEFKMYFPLINLRAL